MKKINHSIQFISEWLFLYLFILVYRFLLKISYLNLWKEIVLEIGGHLAIFFSFMGMGKKRDFFFFFFLDIGVDCLLSVVGKRAPSQLCGTVT